MKKYQNKSRQSDYSRKTDIDFLIGLGVSVVILLVALLFTFVLSAQADTKERSSWVVYLPSISKIDSPDYAFNPCDLRSVTCRNEKTFTVSAYNTVPAQTDSSPCISASGDDICGRSDVVACPRMYPFYTRFIIDGKEYECLDRTARKYGDRLDISFDKDMQGAVNFGIKVKEVTIK